MWHFTLCDYRWFNAELSHNSRNTKRNESLHAERWSICAFCNVNWVHCYCMALQRTFLMYLVTSEKIKLPLLRLILPGMLKIIRYD